MTDRKDVNLLSDSAGSVDVAADIIPGVSAGGYLIGMPWLLDYELMSVEFLLDGSSKVNLGCVSIWLLGGKVCQIGVGDGYLGKVNGGRIGVGSTLADVMSECGELDVDCEDNIVLRDVEGICFETEAWEGSQLMDNLHALVTEIYVFAPS